MQLVEFGECVDHGERWRLKIKDPESELWFAPQDKEAAISKSNIPDGKLIIESQCEFSKDFWNERRQSEFYWYLTAA